MYTTRNNISNTVHLIDTYKIDQALARSCILRLGILRKLSRIGKCQEYIRLMGLPSTPGGAPELSAYASAYNMDVCIRMTDATKFT